MLTMDNQITPLKFSHCTPLQVFQPPPRGYFLFSYCSIYLNDAKAQGYTRQTRILKMFEHLASLALGTGHLTKSGC